MNVVLKKAALLLLALSVSAQAADIQFEMTRLEQLKARGALSHLQSTRLAEIYFLTSRCDDVRKVLGGGRTLLGCACGGGCPSNSDVARMRQLKKVLESGAHWNDHKVQVLWRKIQHMPEARYWALKNLRSNPASVRDVRLRTVRADLEKSLESLEVQP
jgi:hypothetical protein